MTQRQSLRWLPFLAIAALAAGGLALARSDGGDTAAPATPSQPAPELPDRPVAMVDWAQPGWVDLGDGWAVDNTEGDGPLLTVLHDGRPVGLVEHLDFPLETPADDIRAALDAHVAAYIKAMADDRANAPIPDYRFAPDPSVHLSAPDGAVVRYGFRGTHPDGRASERTIQWAGIRAGRLILVAASAYDEGGLFAPEGSEFSSADLDAVAERLDWLVRASGLPDKTRA